MVPGTGPIYNLFLNFVCLCRNTQRHRTFQKLGPCDHYLSSQEMRLGEFNSSSQKVHAVTNGSSTTFVPGRAAGLHHSFLALLFIQTTHKGGNLDSYPPSQSERATERLTPSVSLHNTGRAHLSGNEEKNFRDPTCTSLDAPEDHAPSGLRCRPKSSRLTAALEFKGEA